MDKEWLRNELKKRGRGAQVELAKVLELDATVVNKLVNSSRKISSVEADKIRAWIQGGDTALFGRLPQQPRRAPEQARTPTPVLEPPDVPVWASASAGDDGEMILTAEPIDYIRRSELMRDVKDPFAFYVIGDSMGDVIEQGDQVVINPSRPPQPGKDHVFIYDDGKGTMLALVKRLLRSTPTHWHVRQYNPAKDFDLLKSKWTKALRITEKRYG